MLSSSIKNSIHNGEGNQQLPGDWQMNRFQKNTSMNTFFSPSSAYDEVFDEDLLDDFPIQFCKMYEWKDLPTSIQIKIVSLLTRKMTYVAVCEKLHLTLDEVTQFTKDYNSELDSHLAQAEKIQQVNGECCELMKQGFASGSEPWKAAWQKVFNDDWDPLTMYISRGAANAGAAFLRRFEFITAFDNGPDSNDILDDLKKFGVDNNWYGVWVHGPDSISKGFDEVAVPTMPETPETPTALQTSEKGASSKEVSRSSTKKKKAANKKR